MKRLQKYITVKRSSNPEAKKTRKLTKRDDISAGITHRSGYDNRKKWRHVITSTAMAVKGYDE